MAQDGAKMGQGKSGGESGEKSGEDLGGFGESLASLWRGFGRLLKREKRDRPSRPTIHPNSRSTSSAGPYYIIYDI